MSRKGHCWDNAHMESFFGSLKTEMVYFQKFQRLEEAVAYITDYIRFYNCERLHSSLGYQLTHRVRGNGNVIGVYENRVVRLAKAALRTAFCLRVNASVGTVEKLPKHL